jgi:hypothetical protein
MSKNLTWDELSHDDKLDLLRRKTDLEIIGSYLPTGTSESAFKNELSRARNLWKPENLSSPKKIGGPPKKEILIGAYRDLSRVEAILELIDNSIDIWMRRSGLSKDGAENLNIKISLDRATDTLTYKDDAGGVQENNLPNLVIPGFSETSETESIIGSYFTGGKKAIFKLASDVNIRTRYLNSENGSSDDAFEIHLDQDWLHNSTDYEFPRYRLNDKTAIEKGTTEYIFQLADDDWNQTVVRQILNELSRTYSLLLLRNPKIHISFNDVDIIPLDDLYIFSATNDEKKGKKPTIDLRPQRVQFSFLQEWKGNQHKIIVEIVIGCRTTSAAEKGNDIWGIDFYGNDRLFMHHVQDDFINWYQTILPKGAVRQVMRGFFNFKGPNVFIPWDTHKRHLNLDRPLVDFIRSEAMIKELIGLWAEVYKAVSKSQTVKELIRTPVKPWRKGKDLNIPFSDKVALKDPPTQDTLPESVHRPKIPLTPATEKDIDLKFSVTKTQFRDLCASFKITGTSEDRGTRKLLAESIKSDVLGRRT